MNAVLQATNISAIQACKILIISVIWKMVATIRCWHVTKLNLLKEFVTIDETLQTNLVNCITDNCIICFIA